LNTQQAKESQAGTNNKIEAVNWHKEKNYVRTDLHMKLEIESAPYIEKTGFLVKGGGVKQFKVQNKTLKS